MSDGALRALLLAFARGAAARRRAFLIRAEAPALLADWRDDLTCEQSFKPLHDRLARAGLTTVARLEGTFPLGLCLLTRDRDESLANLARALDHIEPGGTLVAAGDNLLGAQGFEKAVRAVLGKTGSLSKHHARAFWLARPAELPAAIDDWRALGTPRPNADGLATVPGVFSRERTDPGTALLIAHLPTDLAGRVADLGAGCGALARAVLHSERVKVLDCYEAERLALECARLNLGGDLRTRFIWHDVADGLAERGYDTVVMNAPFHDGPRADPALGVAFIEAAAAALRPGGRLLLVANRSLPYEAALARWFASVQLLAEADGYKAVAARKG